MGGFVISGWSTLTRLRSGVLIFTAIRKLTGKMGTATVFEKSMRFLFALEYQTLHD